VNKDLKNEKQGVKEIEYDRLILNLDTEQISRINNHVFHLASQGVKKWDEKNGRETKINKSSWAREIFENALNEAESTSSTSPKSLKKLKFLEEKYGADVIEQILANLENSLSLIK